MPRDYSLNLVYFLLHILIKSLQDQYKTAELDHRYMLPYYNLSQNLFFGFRGLLDPRVDPARYPAEFVLVTTNPTAKEGEAKMDDWGHDGMTWSLTVHEARPGHELQFASMIESGVSQARGIYAFNSANVEGWALYAEAVMKEYLPLGRNSESLDYFPRHSCCCVGRS